MFNLQVINKNILFSLLAGLLFGIVLFVFLPLAAQNIFFVFLIPLICIFLLLMIINVKSMLLVLLFSRALLDPLLNNTKLNIFGENIGIGGAINLFIIILAVALVIRYPKGLSGNSFYKSWIMFLSVCTITVVYSPVLGKATRLLLNLVSYMAMAVIPFFVVDNENEQRFWLRMLIWSSLLPIGFANIDLLRGGRLYIDAGMRIQGSFTHPNILAFYLVFIIVLIFSALKSGLFSANKGKENFLKVYMLNLFILLLATKTRSAWIACWSFFLIYGILKEKKYILIATFLPLLLLFHPQTMQRIRSAFSGTSVQPGVKINSFTWRLELWKRSLPLIKEKIFLGHGLASFREVMGVDAHNTYIKLLFEAGFLGLLGYLAIYLTALRRFFAQHALVFACIISYLVVCFADNLLYYLAFNWYFWFFIGIMLKGIQIEDEKKNICNNTVL